MPSNNSETSTDLAAKMAEKLLGFYPKIPASDPKIFTTGLIEMLTKYPDWVSLRIADPVRGLPGKFKFCPQIAEVKETCDGWVNEKLREDELRERYTPKPLAIGSKWDPPRPAHHATAPALCQRFGIAAIPPGWDAVELTRQAARHGSDFPRVVAEILRNGLPPAERRPISLPQQIANKAREAMQRRLGEAAE